MSNLIWPPKKNIEDWGDSFSKATPIYWDGDGWQEGVRPLKYIIGLDISTRSTGWAVLDLNQSLINYGTISGPIKNFYLGLKEIINNYYGYVVIEDTYFGANVKTLKQLCYYSGIAQLICSLEERPYKMIPVKQARALLGNQNKNEVFEIIKHMYDMPTWEFKTHNDITDAIVLALSWRIHE